MLDFTPRPMHRTTAARLASALRLGVFALLILAVCKPTSAQFGHVLTINSEDGHFSLEADGTPVALSGDGTSASPWVANIDTRRVVEVANIFSVTELNSETGTDGEVIWVLDSNTSPSVDLMSWYFHTTTTNPIVADDFKVTESASTNGWWFCGGGVGTYVLTVASEFYVPSPQGTVTDAGLNIMDAADFLTADIWEFQVVDLSENERTIWDPSTTPSEGDAWIYDGNAFAILPLAAIEKLAVVDIDNPTELNSETGATGAGRLCYEEMADPTAMEFTLYIVDNNTTEAQNPPYSFGGGGTNDLWIAAFGKYAQGPQTRNGSFITVGATSDIQAGDDIVATDDVFALDDLDVTDDSIFGDTTEHRGVAFFEQSTYFAIQPPPDTDGNSWVRWDYSALNTGVTANGYIFSTAANNTTDRPYWRWDGTVDAGETSKTFNWRIFVPVVASQLHGDATQVNDWAITVEKTSPTDPETECDVWISAMQVLSLDATTWTVVDSVATTHLKGAAASPTELVATADADIANVKEGVWLDLQFSICEDPIESPTTFEFKLYVNGSEDSWIELSTQS